MTVQERPSRDFVVSNSSITTNLESYISGNQPSCDNTVRNDDSALPARYTPDDMDAAAALEIPSASRLTFERDIVTDMNQLTHHMTSAIEALELRVAALESNVHSSTVHMNPMFTKANDSATTATPSETPPDLKSSDGAPVTDAASLANTVPSPKAQLSARAKVQPCLSEAVLREEAERTFSASAVSAYVDAPGWDEACEAKTTEPAWVTAEVEAPIEEETWDTAEEMANATWAEEEVKIDKASNDEDEGKRSEVVMTSDFGSPRGVSLDSVAPLIDDSGHGSTRRKRPSWFQGQDDVVLTAPPVSRGNSLPHDPTRASVLIEALSAANEITPEITEPAPDVAAAPDLEVPPSPARQSPRVVSAPPVADVVKATPQADSDVAMRASETSPQWQRGSQSPDGLSARTVSSRIVSSVVEQPTLSGGSVGPTTCDKPESSPTNNSHEDNSAPSDVLARTAVDVHAAGEQSEGKEPIIAGPRPLSPDEVLPRNDDSALDRPEVATAAAPPVDMDATYQRAIARGDDQWRMLRLMRQTKPVWNDLQAATAQQLIDLVCSCVLCPHFLIACTACCLCSFVVFHDMAVFRWTCIMP